MPAIPNQGRQVNGDVREIEVIFVEEDDRAPQSARRQGTG